MKASSETASNQFRTDPQEALSFLGPILRPANPGQLAAEFPLIYQAGEDERRGFRLRWHEGAVVSGAAFRCCQVLTSPQTGLNIGAIGSVATNPDFRGKGFAGEVVLECERALREKGCELALLWAPNPDLYRKLGYAEVGVEIGFMIFAENVVDLPTVPGVVAPFEKNLHLKDCWNLYQQHPVRLQRSLQDFEKLVEIPQMNLVVHRRLGKTTAYGAIGKGADFQGALHEWGGSAEGVFAIVQDYLRRHSSESLPFISSGARSDLIALFEKHRFEKVNGFVGMMKLLDPAGLNAKVAPTLRALGVEIKTQSGGTLLASGKNSLVLPDSTFLRFLFGYKGVSGEALAAAKLFERPELKLNPPIQMFFWGLDSV